MRLIRSFGTGKSGAIAPLYALALLALIAIAGIGFDYGRLVAMQSELQNAADQAALAAVTQLDGRSGAQTRARNAARAYFANQTRVANDGDGRNVTIGDGGFQFFSDGEAGTPATSDADSRAVQVSVDLREVFYALTPVVDAISSGGITASARAGLRKSVCNLPPIMVCVDHVNFRIPAEVGESLRMRWKSSRDIDALAPGNWGFLDFRGEKSSQYELGENETNYCAPLEDVQTEPGFRNTEPEAFNTRFDMSTNKLSCKANGDFCPAQSVRKNWAIEYKAAVVSPNPALTLDDVRGLATCPVSASIDKKASWVSFDNVGVIDLARREFDFVLVDLPTDWTSWALSVALASSAVVLVVEASVASMRQARRKLDLFESVGLERSAVSLVGNRIEHRMFRAIGVAEIREVLEHDLVAALSDEGSAMRSAQDEGLMITDTHRRSRFVSDIEALAASLTSEGR